MKPHTRWKPLGRTRAVILGAVIEGGGVPPTLRDLSRLTGTHTNNVVGHLRALEAAGLIRHDRNVARGLVPLATFIPAAALGP